MKLSISNPGQRFKQVSRTQPIPIFIISYNRQWQLEASIKSYRQLGNIDIIIHDNGSDLTEVQDYLSTLENNGVTINRNPKITAQKELNNVNESIKKYFSKRSKTDYIVTDPDIQLLPGAEDTLSIYRSLLNMFPDIESVGPMLKIDDISKDYPLYINVLNRHIEQFWAKQPSITTVENKKVAYLKSKIDTTFAMHRKGQEFKRLTNGMRLYGTYSARHLDWYKKDTSSDKYFNNSSSAIAHWGNSAFYDQNKDDVLRYSSYYDVSENLNAAKVIRREIHV